MPSSRRLLSFALSAAFGASCLLGCKSLEPTAKKPVSSYPDLGLKTVPEYLRGTIYERVELGNSAPYEVSGYGLVVNLDHTGDNQTLPAAVKSYMTKQMVTEGFGSRLTPGFEKVTPERVLADDRTAVVEVYGMLPPGIRKGQTFDVRVNVVPRNDTSSLAGGELYRTDLKLNGVNPVNPFGAITVLGKAKGFVFVNPAYALLRGKGTPLPASTRAGLRTGIVMDGGIAGTDRPLILQLRQPQASVVRAIEQRIRARFGGDESVAKAHDEGVVELYVPTDRFGTDWKHFKDVCLHTYFNSSPEFAVAKAKQLVDEALKPDAPVAEISYCWEGLGTNALQFLSPLLIGHTPEIEFQAARAMVFIGDDSGAAVATLMEMARTSNHPYQLAAVQTLGSMNNSIAINHMLRELLDSPQSLVRVEAYRILARNTDPSVFSRVITEDPNNQKFILDVVPSKGPALIYATRSGTPRIAIIGSTPQVESPILFNAIDRRLIITSDATQNLLTLFYRDPELDHPINMLSRSDVAEVVGRLGGLAAPDQTPFNFSYGEVVAILQQLSDQKKLSVVQNGQLVAASFVLQEPPKVLDSLIDAPPIDVTGRPQDSHEPALLTNPKQ